MPEPVVTAPEIAGNPAPGAAPNTPVAPETVEVKVGDKTLKVSKDAAEAISALQQSVSEQAALAAAAEARAKAAAPAAPEKPQPENYDRLFQDPKGFLSDFAKQIKEELRSEYTQTTLQREFWTQFYEAHADLKKHDFYVKSVLDRDFDKVAKLKTPEAIQKLGETVKAELLALSGGKSNPAPQKPATEGGTERLPAESKPESEHSPTPAGDTLTGLIKARREARRRGAQPQVQA